MKNTLSWPLAKGKKIPREDGSLFICLIKFPRLSPDFFYMNPDGSRKLSSEELSTGKLPTSNHWGEAKRSWNKKIQDLSVEELELALELAGNFSEHSRLFGFSFEQVDTLAMLASANPAIFDTSE